MRAGQLRHKLEFLALTSSTSHGMGSVGKKWSTTPFATMYGSVWPLRGNEYIEAGQLQADISHRIVVRYTSGVTANKTRVKFGSRYFDIKHAINPEERNISLELLCTENV